jgi:hypothetical protein
MNQYAIHQITFVASVVKNKNYYKSVSLNYFLLQIRNFCRNDVKIQITPNDDVNRMVDVADTIIRYSYKIQWI